MPIFRGYDDKKNFQRGDGGEINKSNDEELSTRKVLRDSESDEASPSVNTQLIGGWKTAQTPPVSESEIIDLVVAWVVVIQGHGRGKSLQLGYGMNTIGRGQNVRVCLDFGDEAISRSAPHAIITYDPRGRKFYLQHSDGKNLTYLNDEPILVPTQLTGGEDILLGQTVLRFIPLCGENFDWQDETK